MRIGLNFTLGHTLEMVRRLVREGHIDYCELLIDNFLHVPPAELASAFDCPVGFHIMASKFIENDKGLLEDMAARIRPYIDALRPMYVSDHVARFSYNGRQLYHLAEIDYRSDYDLVRERAEWWQHQLGQRLYLENYPSIMDGGGDVPSFFERLTREIGTGTLFDASNAVCAHHNCGVPLDAWEGLIDGNRHFHVAGYNLSILEPHIVLDTHDRELAADTVDFLHRYKGKFDKPGATMTYERDDNIDYESIIIDLQKMRDVFGPAKE